MFHQDLVIGVVTGLVVVLVVGLVFVFGFLHVPLPAFVTRCLAPLKSKRPKKRKKKKVKNTASDHAISSDILFASRNDDSRITTRVAAEPTKTLKAQPSGELRFAKEGSTKISENIYGYESFLPDLSRGREYTFSKAYMSPHKLRPDGRRAL